MVCVAGKCGRSNTAKFYEVVIEESWGVVSGVFARYVLFGGWRVGVLRGMIEIDLLFCRALVLIWSEGREIVDVPFYG